MPMSKDGYGEPRRRVTSRSLVPSLIIGGASILFVFYLRIAPSWNVGSGSSFVAAVPPLVLLWVFYASLLVTVANIREMQGTVAGWFDVLGLMVLEILISYLVFADLLYIAIVIALCILFVAYVNLAQSD
jgi:hypothetical protein